MAVTAARMVLYDGTTLYAVNDAGGFDPVTVSGTGDNLGNHTATQDLNMAGFAVNSALKVTFSNGSQFIDQTASNELRLAAGANLYLSINGSNIWKVASDGVYLIGGSNLNVQNNAGIVITNGNLTFGSAGTTHSVVGQNSQRVQFDSGGALSFHTSGAVAAEFSTTGDLDLRAHNILQARIISTSTSTSTSNTIISMSSGGSITLYSASGGVSFVNGGTLRGTFGSSGLTSNGPLFIQQGAFMSAGFNFDFGGTSIVNINTVQSGGDLTLRATSGGANFKFGTVAMRFPSTSNGGPTNGDFWYDGTNLKFRQGGTTRTISWV